MQRRTTNTVHVGDIAIGSGHPIAVQSMLCVAPSDLAANIAQTLVLKEAGCDIVRLAIPTMDDIRLISAIKNEVDIPLVADIQFDYRLAIAAVKAGIDKVRINPGNIGGSDRVHAVAEACRDRHIPIRIGVNSGSLEKDILQKYGRPTAEALVESALRHIQLLEDEHFTDYLVAIKSSDTITTVEANRLLAQKVDCPLHLGVTEAGTERGRTRIDLIGLANQVEQALAACEKPITVAVMGCVVNGPGEAREADIGIAGGNGEFLFFAKGKPMYKVSPEQVINTLLDEVEKL